MLPNLILNTGVNMTNISKQAASDIIVSNTPTTLIAEIGKLTINLNKPTNSILLSGVVDTLISDSAASPAASQILGPVSLQISKPVNGVSSIIYQSTFSLTNMPFTPNISVPYKFSFEWVDSTIASTSCPNMCPENLANCPVNTITYTFQLAVSSGVRPSLSAKVPANSYYSLTAIEIPQ